MTAPSEAGGNSPLPGKSLGPAPVGLPEAGKRVIAVAVLAIGLWCTEALPAGVTSLVLVVALVLSGAVPGFAEALAGLPYWSAVGEPLRMP